VFNKIVGEANAGGLELDFAAFLEGAPDVQAFGKNYTQVGFKLEYVKADGDLATYTPDFIVRIADRSVWIVETKGRAELDVPQKMTRLRLWCADATEASKDTDGVAYGFVYVDQDGFKTQKWPTFAAVVSAFRDYQEI
jgi:type III restriction enzyme